MKTREEALNYALSFAETYQNAPFRDQNWQLVRVKKSKKAFLWTYEKEGNIWLNVKANPETRDFWRAAYDAVIPGLASKQRTLEYNHLGWNDTGKRCEADDRRKL